MGLIIDIEQTHIILNPQGNPFSIQKLTKSKSLGHNISIQFI